MKWHLTNSFYSVNMDRLTILPNTSLLSKFIWKPPKGHPNLEVFLGELESI